jgi:S1-C subfamily serine protease
LGVEKADGAYITSIVTGGPADKAGLKAGEESTSIQGLNKGGDWIIAVDGHPVEGFSEFLSYLVMNKHPGETVSLTILRNGEKLDIQVILDKRP